MYEQNEVPTLRRLLLAILGIIAIAVVIWIVVWLLFVRGDTAQKTSKSHPATSQQSKSSGTNNGAANSSNQPVSGTTGSSTGSKSASTPSNLANTGPGDIATPVIVSSILGGTLYYLRLRRKLQSNL